MNLQTTLKIFLCGFAAIFFVGCTQTDPATSTDTTASGNTIVSATDTAAKPQNNAGQNPQAELVENMKAFLAEKSFRSRMEGKNSDGYEINGEMAFSAPDRYQINMNMNSSQQKIATEVILIGKESYMKMGNSGWQKVPADIGQFVRQIRDEQMLEWMKDSADVKFVGTETIDGVPMNIYEYPVHTPQMKGLKGTAKTWFSAIDKLPHKTESEGETMVGGKNIHTNTVITYYDYGAPIEIERPK
jgi:hypothetical protein